MLRGNAAVAPAARSRESSTASSKFREIKVQSFTDMPMVGPSGNKTTESQPKLDVNPYNSFENSNYNTVAAKSAKKLHSAFSGNSGSATLM